MNKKTKLDQETPTKKIIDDVEEGINDAGTVFSTEAEPLESNSKQLVRYLLWGLLSVIVNFGTFYILYHTIHMLSLIHI